MEQKKSETERPTIDPVSLAIGSGFFTGFAPVASGTVASLAALLFFLLPQFSDPIILIPTTLLMFLLGGRIAGTMERRYGQDPKQVTVDEVVGMWLSLWFIPITWVNVGLAFLIFRVLDILKPYPAGEFDKRSGGWNIMLDDVIAGVYTNLIIQLALRIDIFP